ncbi:MAG: hypothetical protein ACM3ZE_21055 [Myxococcales bacterium]
MTIRALGSLAFSLRRAVRLGNAERDSIGLPENVSYFAQLSNNQDRARWDPRVGEVTTDVRTESYAR